MAELLVGSRKINQLMKSLGAPDHWIEFKLVARADAPVMVEVTYYPEIVLDADGVIPTITKRYKLLNVELEEYDDDGA